ncbi:MAG: rhomboid family intramembrane serine protease [Myxococcota bacterium]|jgi:membrane associated rhomboid family serine protease|nr:rhomboid family intramembrane serine protease [Myxococcota bacterium]
MSEADESRHAPEGGVKATALLEVATREQADERVLVLESQAIRTRIERRDDGYEICLRDPHDQPRAIETLRLWLAENRARPRPRDAVFVSPNRGIDFAGAYLASFALLLFHLAIERFPDGAVLRRAGSANAWNIMNGEVWRVFTALTLHSDGGHVIANTLLGGLFLASLAGRIGGGAALAGALATGGLGNLANAIHHQSGHNSIGASTAVFGVVGLLCGLEAWRRRRLALPWQGAWVPLGAGGALLAMLGAGGGDVDYGAHIYGLVAGMGLGWFVAPRFSPAPPRPALQWAYAIGTAGVLALAWWIAYGTSPSS